MEEEDRKKFIKTYFLPHLLHTFKTGLYTVFKCNNRIKMWTNDINKASDKFNNGDNLSNDYQSIDRIRTDITCAIDRIQSEYDTIERFMNYILIPEEEYEKIKQFVTYAKKELEERENKNEDTV